MDEDFGEDEQFAARGRENNVILGVLNGSLDCEHWKDISTSRAGGPPSWCGNRPPMALLRNKASQPARKAVALSVAATAASPPASTGEGGQAQEFKRDAMGTWEAGQRERNAEDAVASPPSPSSSVAAPSCRLCKKPLWMVAQIYAPVEGPRALHIFGCNRRGCSKRRESWRCFRTQLRPPASRSSASTPTNKDKRAEPGKAAIAATEAAVATLSTTLPSPPLSAAAAAAAVAAAASEASRWLSSRSRRTLYIYYV